MENYRYFTSLFWTEVKPKVWLFIVNLVHLSQRTLLFTFPPSSIGYHFFVLLFSTLVVLSAKRVDLGFFFSFIKFYPPPPTPGIETSPEEPALSPSDLSQSSQTREKRERAELLLKDKQHRRRASSPARGEKRDVEGEGGGVKLDNSWTIKISRNGDHNDQPNRLKYFFSSLREGKGSLRRLIIVKKAILTFYY
mgnify:CR=1 FL=1